MALFVVLICRLPVAFFLWWCGVLPHTLRRSGPVHSGAETHRLSISTISILFSKLNSCLCVNKQSSSTRMLSLRNISFMDKHPRDIQGNSWGKYRTLNSVRHRALSMCSARLCLCVYNCWCESNEKKPSLDNQASSTNM